MALALTVAINNKPRKTAQPEPSAFEVVAGRCMQILASAMLSMATTASGARSRNLVEEKRSRE